MIQAGLMDELGFDTWIYELVPVEKALERLAAFGITHGEYSFEHLSGFEKEGKMWEKARELKELVSSLNVRMVQMHAPFGDLDKELGSGDENMKEKAIGRARRWLDYASLLGVDILVMHTVLVEQDPKLDSISVARRMEESNIEVFSRLSKHAKDLGVKIAIENRLESIFGCKIPDLLEVIKGDPDSLGICLDTGHANVNAIDPSVAAEQAGDFLIATHVHDNDGSGDQHLPPLMGNIDWAAFRRALEKIRYEGPLIVEIPGSNSDMRVCDNRLLIARVSAKAWLSGQHSL
ncbi:MAG: sugar phosphate isomerase/epimerase family protein [Thermoproteota archaeon]